MEGEVRENEALRWWKKKVWEIEEDREAARQAREERRKKKGGVEAGGEERTATKETKTIMTFGINMTRNKVGLPLSVLNSSNWCPGCDEWHNT